MKRETIEILACPLCKGDLELEVTEEKGEEVWAGCLTCSACQLSFAIIEGVPNLLSLEIED